MSVVCLCLAGMLGISGCSLFGGDDTEYTHWEPDLSPDGRFVAYESTSDSSLEVFTQELATSTVRRLTNNDFPDWGPTWSPDGTRIAFSSSRDNNVDIYMVDVNSLVVERLTMHEKEDINADWGVDGLIYFNSDRSGDWEIYTIDPDERRLTKLTSVESTP
ncbi:hypothetical protein KJ567_05910 [Candidatus Bipolaricaulota bacterium]|nr:hypothetical protein [Candidatus Bipolaricaulota bacterium]